MKKSVRSLSSAAKSAKLDAIREIARPEPADWSKFASRPAVITIMGHVDHGKTSILDRFRNSRLVDKEFGGITQQIGAFSVTLPGGKRVTLLDTPGHAAFEAMRARGASVTDICILVVAADDSVKPQTVEAIRHIKASAVPMIVAINKIDKPAADADRTKGSLAEHDVVVEDYGGDIPSVEVSALTGENFDKLEEVILAVAEVEDFRGDSSGAAEAIVLEAKRDPQKGILATLLVTRGTLKPRDILVAGKVSCRVRSITDDKLTAVKMAGPSSAVEVSGWRDLPEAGDMAVSVPSDDAVRRFLTKLKSMESPIVGEVTREYEKALNLVVIADTQGSLEAIQDCLKRMPFQDELPVRVISAKVGQIAEGDIKNAATTSSDVYIFGQARQPSRQLLALAAAADVKLKQFRVVYDLLNEVKLSMADKLPPVVTEETIGEALITAEFAAKDGGRVAGCRILTGKLSTQPNTLVRVLPAAESDQRVIWEGKVKELRHFKSKARELSAPKECGVLLENYNSFPTRARLVCITRTFSKRVL